MGRRPGANRRRTLGSFVMLAFAEPALGPRGIVHEGLLLLRAPQDLDLAPRAQPGVVPVRRFSLDAGERAGEQYALRAGGRGASLSSARREGRAREPRCYFLPFWAMEHRGERRMSRTGPHRSAEVCHLARLTGSSRARIRASRRKGASHHDLYSPPARPFVANARRPCATAAIEHRLSPAGGDPCVEALMQELDRRKPPAHHRPAREMVLEHLVRARREGSRCAFLRAACRRRHPCAVAPAGGGALGAAVPEPGRGAEVAVVAVRARAIGAERDVGRPLHRSPESSGRDPWPGAPPGGGSAQHRGGGAIWRAHADRMGGAQVTLC